MACAEGNRLYLREYAIDDFAAFADWQCDAEVGRFVDFLPVSEQIAHERLSEAVIQQTRRDQKHFYMAVVRRDEDEVIGGVGIELLDEKTGDIGWFLRRKYWGQGYATEATELMIRKGFLEMGLTSIRASCRKKNRQSEKIMRKCGMSLVNTTDDRLYYYLTYEQWRYKS